MLYIFGLAMLVKMYIVTVIILEMDDVLWIYLCIVLLYVFISIMLRYLLVVDS